MNDTRRPSHRYLALDSWRGIAALGVVMHHVSGDHGLVSMDWHGALGLCVDFFFVLSGFVIAGAYGQRLAQGFPVRTFLWLRLGRIYPMHVVVLVIYIVVELVLAILGWTHGGHHAFTGTREPSAILPTLLLVQAFTMPGQDSWNIQSWSISVELWLYVVWALAWRLIGRGAVPLAVLVSAALMAIAAFRPEWIGPQMWAVRGFCGFGLGMGTWLLHERIGVRELGNGVATALELVLVVAAAAAVVPFAPLIVADPVFAGLVLVFAFQRGAVSRLLQRGPFVLVGTISYSLYMIHGFVLGRCFDVLAAVEHYAGVTLVGKTWFGSAMLVTGTTVTNLLTVAMMAASVGVGWVFWRFVEEPARRWSRDHADTVTGHYPEAAPI
ncbi:MAG: acyltransferase [Novosphingobium sp.]